MTCLGGQFERLEADLVLVPRTGNRDGVLDIERDWRVLGTNVEVFETECKVIVSLVE